MIGETRGHRIGSWVKVRLLTVRCSLRGHNYGQHFNELFHGALPDEVAWCDHCGRERP